MYLQVIYINADYTNAILWKSRDEKHDILPDF